MRYQKFAAAVALFSAVAGAEEPIELVEPHSSIDCVKPNATNDEFGIDWKYQSILANDDDGGCDVTITITRAPYNGDLAVNADGTFQYSPDYGFSGDESFRYNLKNDSGANKATTFFTVGDPEPVEPPSGIDCVKPNATNDEFGSDWEDQSILANDDDGGCDLTITITRAPYNGDLAINADGTFQYSPDYGFSGDESFRYNIKNDTGANKATTFFTVGDPEPAEPPSGINCVKPNATNDEFGSDWKDQSILANDDDGGCDVTITINRAPSNGDLAVNADGTFQYSPDYGFIGDQSFRYSLWNDAGENRATTFFTVGDPEPEDPNEPDSKDGAYPVPAMTYTPDYPPLGQYSMPGVCEAIHDETAATVVLQDGEKLDHAWQRLYAIAPGVGGVIEVPYDAELVQCDTIRVNSKNVARMPTLTLRGTTGPNGEQPRFYCRSDNFESGTVPHSEIAGQFITWGGIDGSKLLVENIHKDGYKRAITLGSQGHSVIRNNYFHHGTHDGISSINSVGATEYKKSLEEGNAQYLENAWLNMEVCGIEIGMHGQGNTIHNFYMHRTSGGGGGHPDNDVLQGGPGWARNVMVDSVCHTPNHSSCFKSIANEVILKNNKFYQYLETDPTFLADAGEGKWGRVGLMLVDISACSLSEITGNEFYGFKPDQSTGGTTLIAYRERKRAVRGCDIPVMWTPYGQGYKDENYSATGSGPQPTPITEFSGVHTEKWWEDLNRKIFFPHIFTDNYISSWGESAESHTGVDFYSTRPTYETSLGSPACLLPIPEAWYERAHVYTKGNRFVNITNAYGNRKTATARFDRKCPYLPEWEETGIPGPDNLENPQNFTDEGGDTFSTQDGQPPFIFTGGWD